MYVEAELMLKVWKCLEVVVVCGRRKGGESGREGVVLYKIKGGLLVPEFDVLVP